VAAGIRYSTRHKLPIGWDEAVYINQVRFDRDTLVGRGPIVFARKQIGTERWRPPGYRLAAAPVALIAGAQPPVLRVLSLGSLVLTGALLLLAGRATAGTSGGVIWAGAFAMAAGPFDADLLLGTELPLYPALAGTALAVSRWYTRGVADRWTRALLFISTVVGGLSKLSFLVVFIPFGLAALTLAPGKDGWWRSRGPVIASVVLGGLAVAPWWLYNWREAMHYASYASDFVRGYTPWLSGAARRLLGWPLAVGLAAVVLWGLTRPWVLWRSSDRPARNLMLTCITGSLPLVVLHVMSDNHNMRLLTPAWVMGAGVIPLALHLGGALHRPFVPAAAALVLIAQTAWLVPRYWGRVEAQIDWNPLRELTVQRGLRQPLVGQLGLSPGFNPPMMEFAWRSRGEWARARWIWRWEFGPIDWDQVDARVDSIDVAVTTTRMGDRGARDDNGHNLEFADRLLRTGWMVDTLNFEVDGHKVLVFTRKPDRSGD
jgi:hypothetical protein